MKLFLILWIVPTIIIFAIKWYELKQIIQRPLTRKDIFNSNDDIDKIACIPIINLIYLIILFSIKRK